MKLQSSRGRRDTGFSRVSASLFCVLLSLNLSNCARVVVAPLPPERVVSQEVKRETPEVTAPFLVRYNRGVILLDGALRLGSPLKDAENEFEAALSLKPGFWAALFNLAYISYADGRYDDGLNNIEAALSYGKTREAELLKAAILEKGGNASAAVKQYLMVAKKYSNAQFAFGHVGAILMRQKRYPEAVKYLEKTGRLKKERYQIFINKGTCYLNMASYKKAADVFSEVYDLGIRDRYLLAQYAFSLRKKGDVKLALVIYKELITLHPEESAAYKNVGIIYDFYMNRPGKALRYYSEYIERGGRDSKSVENWRRIAVDRSKGWFK